jgi:hypothetical protein
MMNWVWLVLSALGIFLLWFLMEVVGSIISEAIIYVIYGISYGIGWYFLRLVTFGRYPSAWSGNKTWWIAIIGFVVLAAIVAAVYFLCFIK